MSKTVLANIAGWTPLLDRLVERHGLITAAVFGKIWRYCQGDYGVCTASQQRIADELGLTRETVNQHCKFLVENGYLEAHNNGRTNTYRDTGKAGLLLQITSIDPLDEPVNLDHTSDDATCESNSQQVLGKVTAGVNLDHTKKVFKRQDKKVSISSSSDENFSKVCKAYEAEIGSLTGHIGEEIELALEDHPVEWILAAIHKAAENNKRAWSYVKGILRKWKAQGSMIGTRQQTGGSSGKSEIDDLMDSIHLA